MLRVQTALRRYRKSLQGVDIAVEAFQAAKVSMIVQVIPPVATPLGPRT